MAISGRLVRSRGTRVCWSVIVVRSLESAGCDTADDLEQHALGLHSVAVLHACELRLRLQLLDLPHPAHVPQRQLQHSATQEVGVLHHAVSSLPLLLALSPSLNTT